MGQIWPNPIQLPPTVLAAILEENVLLWQFKSPLSFANCRTSVVHVYIYDLKCRYAKDNVISILIGLSFNGCKNNRFTIQPKFMGNEYGDKKIVIIFIHINKQKYDRC